MTYGSNDNSPATATEKMGAIAATALFGLSLLALFFALRSGSMFSDLVAYLELVGGRLLELGLSIGIGFCIGAALSPKFREVRYWLFMGGLALVVIYSLLFRSPAADVMTIVVRGIAGLVAFYVGIRLGARKAAAADKQRPTSYGSAKWATETYLAQKGLFGSSGYLLGTFMTAKRELCRLHYSGARHLLTVAPTRSGKGVSAIIPNLLHHPGSVIVIDPKGENALITAKHRGAGDPAAGIPGLGQRVVLLDPWDVAASKLGMTQARFNPIDWIKAGDPDAAENAFLLADALVVPEGGADSAFWDEEAKALLPGLIMYVATASEEEGRRNLGRVREILTMPIDSLQTLLERMYTNPEPLVRSMAARTLSKEAKLVSGVLATAQAHTHFLESPRIRESLSASDFGFDELKTKAVSVFLILPSDRLSTFNRWMRLLLQQAITVNARNIDVTPKAPILFMLDEMATLGRLPAIEQAYGLMAGFGMQLWGIVQDLSQLAKIYGEHGWQTFISNSGVIQYLGSRDRMTAEYFSKLCGVTTIEVRNISWAIGKVIGHSWGSSTGSGPGGGSSSSNSGGSSSDSWTRTTGVSEAQRQLAYPDELMVLKDRDQIIFVENLDPIIGVKMPWYADPAFAKLGVNLHDKAEATAMAAPSAKAA